MGDEKFRVLTENCFDFQARAKNYGELAQSYDKWAISCLLLGSGAAFLFVSKQIVLLNKHDVFAYLYLACAWFFAFALYFAFAATANNVSLLYDRREEMTLKNNYQDVVKNYNVKMNQLRDHVKTKACYKSLKPDFQKALLDNEKFLIEQSDYVSKISFEHDKDTANLLKHQFQDLDQKSNERHLIVKKCLTLSFLMLFIGFTIPLVFFTVNIVFPL